jgi:hypothetical protein
MPLARPYFRHIDGRLPNAQGISGDTSFGTGSIGQHSQEMQEIVGHDDAANWYFWNCGVAA